MTAPVLFQALPPLSREEYSALEQSIKEYGVQSPIVVDERGVIIDGHHRDKIAEDLGIDCPRIVRADLDETAKRSLALSLNIDRRHLTREQKRALVEESLKADPQLSDRQHAARTGVSPSTAGAARADLVVAGQVSKLDTSRGADGKTYARPAFAAATNRHPEPGHLPRPERTVQVVESPQDVADHLAALDDVLRDEAVDTTTGEIGAAPRSHGAPHQPSRRQLKTDLMDAWKPLSYLNNRLQRLVDDDRLKRNAFYVAHHLSDELRRSLRLTTDLLVAAGDELGTSEEARARWASDLFTAAEALQRLSSHLTKENS